MDDNKSLETEFNFEDTADESLNKEDDTLEDIKLTHEELKKVSIRTLNELLQNNVVLRDLPSDVTLEEINAQIAVLHGQSMTIYVHRGDNEEIPVIVKQKNSTVSDLKRAFQRAMTLKLRRQGEKSKISWKHVWRIHWLSCEGSKLHLDNGYLRDYNVVNKSRVTFIPKLKDKRKYKHFQNKKT